MQWDAFLHDNAVDVGSVGQEELAQPDSLGEYVVRRYNAVAAASLPQGR